MSFGIFVILDDRYFTENEMTSHNKTSYLLKNVNYKEYLRPQNDLRDNYTVNEIFDKYTHDLNSSDFSKFELISAQPLNNGTKHLRRVDI